MKTNDDSIPVSPEHGLNPTMAVCFWCGEHRGDIGLLGQIDDEDSEAPREAVLDYEPCDECKEEMSLGITIAECTEPGKPTGRWVVVSERFLENVTDEQQRETIRKERKVQVSPDAFEQLIGGVSE